MFSAGMKNPLSTFNKRVAEQLAAIQAEKEKSQKEVK